MSALCICSIPGAIELARQSNFQFFPEFAGVVHLDQDVRAAHEFPFDVNLGNGGPAGKVLDSLANFHIGKNIECLECHTEGVQDLDHVV